MRIFVLSIIGGIIGLYGVGSLGGANIWSILGGIAGFTLPYAIVLEKIYEEIKAKKGTSSYGG